MREAARRRAIAVIRHPDAGKSKANRRGVVSD
jgi:peptide subunit release factor RF-3